nr:hypothetical protein [Tanacetum cinerariifolium]
MKAQGNVGLSKAHMQLSASILLFLLLCDCDITIPSIDEEKRHDEKEDELYRDVNINQGRGLPASLEVEDSHVTLTSVKLDGQQESSLVSSQFVTILLNPTLDVGMESIFETTSENDEFLKTVDENLKKIIKEQVKEQVKAQVSKILPRIEQAVNEKLKPEVLTRSSHSSRTSYAVATDLSEMELKKILIEEDAMTMKIRMKNPLLDQTRGQKDADKKPPTPDRAWNKTLPAVYGSIQPWINELAKQADTRSSFNELMDTPLDFSNFLMNLLRVDTLTPELLDRPTYELMKGSCKILIELEYHLEEVYKATTDQLDWVNHEGQQYPHNLLQPLPLIPDNRGRRVIPI